jgi:hypothetical protein
MRMFPSLRGCLTARFVFGPDRMSLNRSRIDRASIAETSSITLKSVDNPAGDQQKWTNAAGSGGGVVELVLKRAAARSPN